VTRFADYTVVYGSLAAAVATLIWLYMVSISILIGAEFNAQLFPIPCTHDRDVEAILPEPANPQAV
jgi:membrane protein